MPLETGTYISDLNASNPAHVDGLNQADSHIRLIKSVLKTSFPNFAPGGAVQSTPAQLDAALLMTVSHGQLRGPGLPRCGQFVDFPLAPSTRFTSGAVAAGGQAAVDHVECDGSVYNISDFPDLGAYFGSTFGGNGTTTFAVPNLHDTGRFRRSRSGALSAGTSQSNQNQSHTHTGQASGTTDTEGAAHAHAFSGTTSGQSNDHSHTYSEFVGSGTAGGAAGTAWAGSFPTANTGGYSADHTHTYSGATGTESAPHAHTFTSGLFTTSANGGTEARPEAFVQVVTVKT